MPAPDPQTGAAPNPRPRPSVRHAVIVGINTYRHRNIRDLNFARHDAQAIYEILVDPRLGQFSPSNVTLLVDERATRSNVISAIGTRLRKAAGQNDLVCIYYGGHGAVEPDAAFDDGLRKYLVPYDGDPEDLYATAIPMEQIAELFKRLLARQVLVFLDTCYSGGASGRTFRTPVAAQAKSVNLSRAFLDRLGRAKEGRFVISSCGPNELALEPEELGHGLFTHHLTAGLRGAADRDQDGLVSMNELFEYLSEHVPDSAARFGGAMTPIKTGSTQGRVFLTQVGEASAPARDASAAGDAPGQAGTASHPRSLEELRLLYDKTAPTQRPCAECSVDDLDWSLVGRYAAKTGMELSGDRNADARALGLFSALSPSALTVAGVLCFAEHPERYIPQARAVFINGSIGDREFERIDVLGPLPRQLEHLFDLVERRIQSHWLGDQETGRFMLAVREALSNAVVHRDYSRNGHVKVTVQFPKVEIISPGGLPEGRTWMSLLESEPMSDPTDAAVAWYLTSLLAAETVGRGFEIFRQYRSAFGAAALEGQQIGEGTALRVAITQVSEAGAGARTPEKPGPSFTELFAPPLGEPSGSGRGRPVPAGSGRPGGSVEEPSASDSLQPGSSSSGRSDGHPQTLGRFRVVRLVGKGGAGTVYLGRDQELERDVAIKVLFKRFGSPTQQERFTREARSAASLSHPGLVSVYEVGQEDDYYFIVMEYIDGPTLQDVIEGRSPSPEFDRDSARIVLEVAEALAYAHSRGIIHRDVKPGNIMLDQTGRPRITDFGLAQTSGSEDTNLTQTGTLLGTATYVSPEQVMGQASDGRSDIYSLGVVFCELLTGKTPFSGKTTWEIAAAKVKDAASLPERDPPVPAALGDICLKALDRAPQLRFQDASEMAEALRGWLAEGGAG